MPQAPGRQLLHYRLIEQIGEGGMGVVWRATDTSLDREVAIKILPPDVAADAERLARFEREARLLASLNHPNIAAVYGLHEADGVRFLAMELASGADLAARLEAGALAVHDALDIARQVAEALEAAHERGVIHRDLKPSNIQVGADGAVKVLDFGLAKALEAGRPDAGGSDVSRATMTSPARTQAGVILGTAAYMSPEQARGKPLDRRTDLWSFGCVLYEMLTGRQAFPGETITDVLSAVISREPDLDRLPPDTPSSVRRLLDRCLVKDARHRQSDAADARLEIEDAGRASAEPATGSSEPAAQRVAVLPWVIAAGALLAAVVAWTSRGAEQTAGPVVVGVEPLTGRVGSEYMPAISPDGRYVAYVARDGNDFDIFLLRIGGANPINLTADYDGWDGAPAFSPDGNQIAFSSAREGGGLFVMGATGESPRRVANEGAHPSWSPDGSKLVAATEQVDDPFSRATRSRVFIVDIDSGDTRDLPVGEDGVGPRWSPDGQRIAFWNEIDGQRDLWTIGVDGSGLVAVTKDAATDWEPMWAEDGRVLYFHSDRGGSEDLWRVPIDPASGAAAGSPTPLTIGVLPIWESSLSADGTRLVASMREATSTLLAYPFDPESAKVVGSPETVAEFGTLVRQPMLRSDGRAMVLRTVRPREVVSTLNLTDGTRRRLVDDEFRNRGPAWSPDDEWIAIYTNRAGPYQIWLVRPDGTDLHPIYEASSSDPTWSPDSDRLAISIGQTGWRTTGFLTRTPGATAVDAPWILDEHVVDGFFPEAWSPDGRRLLGTTVDRATLAVYDLDTRERLTSGAPPGNDAQFESAWMNDSERVLYWDPEAYRVMVWNTRTGTTAPLAGVEGPGTPMVAGDDRTLYFMQRRISGNIWMLTLGEPGTGGR